jgi:hypothetical protein
MSRDQRVSRSILFPSLVCLSERSRAHLSVSGVGVFPSGMAYLVSGRICYMCCHCRARARAQRSRSCILHVIYAGLSPVALGRSPGLCNRIGLRLEAIKTRWNRSDLSVAPVPSL